MAAGSHYRRTAGRPNGGVAHWILQRGCEPTCLYAAGSPKGHDQPAKVTTVMP
jgi:hypothetical protein